MLSVRSMLFCVTIAALSLTGIVIAESIHQDLMFENDKDAGGKAILDYAKGADKTKIQVECSGLKPRAKYVVLLSECADAAPDYIELGIFITDKRGNGDLLTHVEGDYPNWFVVVGIVVDRVLVPLGWWDAFPFGCPGPYKGFIPSPLEPYLRQGHQISWCGVSWDSEREACEHRLQCVSSAAL